MRGRCTVVLLSFVRDDELFALMLPVRPLVECFQLAAGGTCQ